MAVRFFTEEITFKLPHPRKTSTWIKEVIKKENGQLNELNYIFCSDQYLHSINQQYLNHNTLTDIITFGHSEKGEPISGEIYISIERVEENARQFEVSIDEELHRVIIHGVLHLLGFKDKKSSDKTLMRKKEEAYLSLRK